ncbi:MAG TPA: metallophosphoesterase family protein [Anaerolineales bacterium]|nr:metallophosphoesterase family protein [Anaerolineales bacterium]
MHILLISDIHANLAALEAVIKDAGHFDQVWCLGDVVGYGPEPNECISRLREFDLICLAGNHDLAVVGKTALWEFTQNARDVIFWTRHWLTTSNHDWLASLPSTPLVVGHGITLVHASPRDPIWEYIVDRETARDNFERIETPVCLCGHSHIPIIFHKPWEGLKILEEDVRVNLPFRLISYDRVFINPGSVGQPRDEDPRASYVLIDLDAMTITHRRVQYDFSATQKLMKQAKFPDRLIRRLRFGQ